MIIYNVAQLIAMIGEEFTDQIKETAIAGDPDWLHDISGELDYIKPGDTFFLPDFHGKLQSFGIKSADIDTDAILKEMLKTN